jgi:hypothetical protein
VNAHNSSGTAASERSGRVVGIYPPINYPYLRRTRGRTYQAGVRDAINAETKGGNVAERGQKVNTPGGTKESGIPDVQVMYADGKVIKYVQVGVANKNGTPVSREQAAAADITGAEPVPVSRTL